MKTGAIDVRTLNKICGTIGVSPDEFYNGNLKSIDRNIERLKNKATYTDSYYLGRMLGDAASMTAAIGAGAKGAAAIIQGVGTGVGGTAASGGTAAVPAVVAGAAEIAAGGLVVENAVAAGNVAFSNFGEDYGYYKKYSCEKNSGSNASSFKFPKSNNDMKKVFGVNDKVFHKEIKPEIIKQINKDPIYRKEFKKMGNNPDIGVDSAGNVVLKDVKTGKTLQTNWSFKSFIP